MVQIKIVCECPISFTDTALISRLIHYGDLRMTSHGGCFSFLKFLVFTVNFILWLVGLGVLGVSLWLLFDRKHFTSVYLSSTEIMIFTHT